MPCTCLGSCFAFPSAFLYFLPGTPCIAYQCEPPHHVPVSTRQQQACAYVLSRLSRIPPDPSGLLQLSNVNEQLTTLIDGTGSPSAAQLHALQRHREVLGDYTVDFRKTKVDYDVWR